MRQLRPARPRTLARKRLPIALRTRLTTRCCYCNNERSLKFPAPPTALFFSSQLSRASPPTLTEAETCYEKEELERRISRLLHAVAMLIRPEASGAEIEKSLEYFMADYLNPHTADEELQRAE